MGIMVLPTQAYSLRISKQPAAFSVLSFEGAETISEPYHFEIKFTCARAQLPIVDVLGKRAKFAIEPVDPNAGLAAELAARVAKPPERLVNGIITAFDELSSSADETRYRVKPMHHHGDFVETYSVEAVEAFDHDTAKRFEYIPFSTFRHRGGMLRHEAPERYFHTRVRQGVKGLFDTWIILGGHAWESMPDLPEETLSLRVTGTNGMLPRKGLREASINELVASAPNVGWVRNLISPTVPVYPPVNDRFQWRLLSHLAPNFLSLMDAEVLRGALALYDWTSDELNRRRLAGIQHVSQKLLRKVIGGGIERGVLIEVTIDSNAFAGAGDLYLFGELLHRFFALYAEINLFTQLSIISLPSGKRLEWAASHAERSSL